MPIIAVQHVVVDNVAREIAVRDSGWSIFAAWAAAFAAIATFFLAWLTRNLAAATTEMARKTADLSSETSEQAKASVEAIAQAQRHHEQSLMPIVFVNFDCTARTAANKRWIQLKGEVRNIGPGPATEIYLHLRAATYVPEYAIYLGVIGANSQQPVELEYEMMSSNYIESIPFDCVTRYSTIFETEGAVVQHSHSGLKRDIKVAKYFPPITTSKTKIATYLATQGFPTRIIS